MLAQPLGRGGAKDEVDVFRPAQVDHLRKGVTFGNDSDRLKQPNPTSFQNVKPHSPTRCELFGLAGPLWSG